MSHALHIWERPLPTSLADAQAAKSRLSAESGPDPEGFAHLRKALTSALTDDPALAGMRYEGLDDGLLTGPVRRVGVPQPFSAALVPLLVAEALALGLAVYDEQAGVCYHPLRHKLTLDGQQPIRPSDLLPRPLKAAGVWLEAQPKPQELGPDEQARAWIAQRRRLPAFQDALLAKGPQGLEPMDSDNLWMQARVLRHLGPWFTAQGFVERSSSAEATEFARLTAGGLQSWSLSHFLQGSTPSGTGPGFSVRCAIRPWLPEMLDGPGNAFPLVPPPHEPQSWGHGRPTSETRVLVRTRAELERVLAAFRPSLDTGLLPLLEACRTPEGILALARQTGTPHPLVPTAALQKLAHWEGAPDHQALLQQLHQRDRALGGHPANLIWPACRLRALPQAFGTMRPRAPGP